jgi:hypothetical protein
VEWYGIEIVNVDGYWHNPACCPVKDGPHTAITDCAFYYDGDTLGWKDFSQGCAGSKMSIGGLLRHLNQEHEPYPERIWPGEGTDWLDDDQISQIEPDDRPKQEICQAPAGSDCPCKREHAYNQKSNLSAGTRATLDAILKMADEDTPAIPTPQQPATSLSPDGFAARIAQGAHYQAFVEGGLKPMPPDAMYGWLGAAARRMDLPLGMAYPAILTCYSALPTMKEIFGNHYALFTVAVMTVGGGKNVTLNRSARILEMRPGDDYMNATLGGVGGLWQLLGEKTESGGKGKEKKTIQGPARMLINPSEFGATMINMKIKNSTLATHLCDLWDKPQTFLPVREGTRAINCRLSILGALPADKDAPETFTRYFSVETGEGLYSRFLFAFSDEKLDLRWAEEWKPNAVFHEDMCDDIIPIGNLKGWTPEAREYYSHILLPYDQDGRGLQNLKRVALLSSLANRDEYVTEEAVRCAELFMLWQAQLKKRFLPGMSEQINHGELSTIIMDTLARIDKAGSYDQCVVIDGALQINIHRVIHNCGWKRYGIGDVERTIKSLIQTGQLKSGLCYKAGNLQGERVVKESKGRTVMVTRF